MILPKDEECSRVIKELDGDPGLSQWEADFVANNRGRQTFTDRQREVVAELIEKYEV